MTNLGRDEVINLLGAEVASGRQKSTEARLITDVRLIIYSSGSSLSFPLSEQNTMAGDLSLHSAGARSAAGGLFAGQRPWAVPNLAQCCRVWGDSSVNRARSRSIRSD